MKNTIKQSETPKQRGYRYFVGSNYPHVNITDVVVGDILIIDHDRYIIEEVEVSYNVTHLIETGGYRFTFHNTEYIEIVKNVNSEK